MFEKNTFKCFPAFITHNVHNTIQKVATVFNNNTFYSLLSGHGIRIVEFTNCQIYKQLPNSITNNAVKDGYRVEWNQIGCHVITKV